MLGLVGSPSRASDLHVVCRFVEIRHIVQCDHHPKLINPEIDFQYTD